MSGPDSADIAQTSYVKTRVTDKFSALTQCDPLDVFQVNCGREGGAAKCTNVYTHDIIIKLPALFTRTKITPHTISLFIYRPQTL